MRHRVETHHVRGAEGAGAGAAELLAGQVVDQVIGQAELLGLAHRRQHAGDADAVGDEVRRVLGAHHALAERGGGEGLELVEIARLGGRRRDQLDQLHVARRVEEVDAAEARLQRLGQRLRQRGDRQARGVRRQDRVRRDVRRDLLVERVLPVQALGDRLDHQVALGQQRQIVLVVGGADARGLGGETERRRLELLQVLDRLQRDGALRAGLAGGRGQVEQHDRHAHIDQMGGDLRAHHAGAEHGDLADIESTHECFLVSGEMSSRGPGVSRRGPRSACGPAAARRCSRAPPAAGRRRPASCGPCRSCRCSGRGSRRRPTVPGRTGWP